jgi:hypothetical protein
LFPGLGNDRVARGIVEVFSRGDIAVFTFSMARDGEEPRAKLGKFNGTLVAAAESRLKATDADVSSPGRATTPTAAARSKRQRSSIRSCR